jgi:lipoyl synthase
VRRYVPPAMFQALEDVARRMGFAHVACGPLVRSSYHADRQALAAGVS